jgi:FKBP-type peptidyl-prolyl cis-trans isomerase
VTFGVSAALLVAAVAACGDDPTTVQLEVIEESTFADHYVTASDDTIAFDLGMMTAVPVEFTTGGSTNVYFQDLEVGVGDTAVEGDQVFMTYNGWIRDGTLFDDNVGGPPFDYTFRVGGVIAGMHFGMQGQKVGGTRLVVIPPELAYGYQGNGVIYPGAIVLFQVRLDSIQPAP